MIYFKLYGQKRTGTNYFASIIINNFENTKVFMNVGGWKHGKIINIPDGESLVKFVDTITKKKINIENTINLFKNNLVNFIILIKNPYLWIYSMSNFENQKITSRYVKKRINTWNFYNKKYKIHIENNNAYLVKYEDLIKNPEETMNNIKLKFNLNQKNNVYKFEKNELHANGDASIGKIKNKKFKNDHYLNEELYIKKFLEKDIIKLINNTIDKSLLEFYQYNLVKI